MKNLIIHNIQNKYIMEEKRNNKIIAQRAIGVLSWPE